MKIRILDTGYLNSQTALGSQTQAALADRAGYTGSTVTSFELKVQNLALSGNVNTENRTPINTRQETDTSLVGVDNRVLNVNCMFDKDTDAGIYEYNEIHEFLRMSRTEGLKLIYTDSTDNTNKTIIEALGSENIGAVPFSTTTAVEGQREEDGQVLNTLPYLVGRVKNISVSDNETSNWFSVSFVFELSEQPSA